MASRSKKKFVRTNKENAKEIRYLEILLTCSLKNINGKSDQLDSLFSNQATRLKKQIQKLKEKQ